MGGKKILITGAAQGLGAELARLYAKQGAQLALLDLQEEKLKALAQSLGAETPPIAGFCDTRDIKMLDRFIQDAAQKMGGLDLVIANAGLGVATHIENLTLESMENSVNTNTKGTLATLMASLPIMLKQPTRGHLVAISSMAGMRGLPTAGAYSASKSAIITFMETLRIDLRKSGIKVTEVRPAFMITDPKAFNSSMPFATPVEKAAKLIVRRLERAPGVIRFPSVYTVLMWTLKMIPRAVYQMAGQFVKPVDTREPAPTSSK